MDSEGPAPAEVRALLDAAVAEGMQRCHVPGVAVSVVHGGRTVVSAGWGLADLEQELEVTPDTRFCIASVTKSVTATAVMQQVEHGTLDLDADVGRWLGAGLVPDGAPISLAHLLTHSSGLDDTLVGCGVQPGTDVLPLAHHLADHPPARFAAPGRVFGYGNHNASLAGLVLERATGVPYEDYVTTRLFAPLGMTRSAFGRPVDGPVAVPYTSDGDTWSPQPWPELHDTPAGAVTSTANDMARFALAHLGHGPPLLTAETLASMHSRRFSLAPGIPGTGLGFFESRAGDWTTWTHEGAMGGFQALLTLVPELGLGVFVATNAASDTCDLPSELTDDLVLSLFPAAPQSALALPVVASETGSLAGRYRAVPRSWSNFERVAALVGREVDVVQRDDGALTLDGEPWTRIGPATFLSSDQRTRVAFVADPDLGLVMSTGLRTYRRIPWIAWSNHQIGALILSLVWLAGVGVCAPAVALVRRRTGVHLAAAWCLAFTALSFVGVFVAPFVQAGGPQWVPAGPPAWWSVRTPLLGLAIAAWVAVSASTLAPGRRGCGRAGSATVGLAGLVVLAFAVGWKLAS